MKLLAAPLSSWYLACPHSQSNMAGISQFASTIGKMPEQLLDNPRPMPEERDPDVEANAAGGPAPIPQVSINRSTVAELEGRG